jgi:hypothetical protein
VRTKSLLLMFAGLALVAVHRLPAQGAKPLKERVLAEVPAAYERYRTYAQKLQGKINDTSRWQKAGKRIEDRRYFTIKSNKNCVLLAYQSLGASRFEGKVVAVNPEYAFQIKRSRPEADWLLVRVEPGGDGTSFEGESVRRLVEALVSEAYEVERVPLLDLLTKGSEYKILGVTAVRRNGVDTVQIKFDSSHPYTRLPFSPVQGGTVFLDPSHDWHILEYNLKAEWADGKGAITKSFVYRNADGAIAIPEKSRHITQNHSNPALGGETVTEYDLQEPSKLPPDEEFTLSAYGLPEPPGLGKKPTPWYLWAAILGFVCLGLAVLLRWRARRTTTN